MRRVGQHDRGEVTCGGRRPNRPGVTARGEQWKASGVVDVCVRENDRIQYVNRKRELLVLRVRFRPMSLEHAAIEHDRPIANPYEVTRSGDFARSTHKGDVHRSG
jgi:hypothetical protein